MEESKLIEKYIIDGRSWVITYHRDWDSEPGDSEVIVRYKPGNEKFQLFYTEADSGEKSLPYENDYFLTNPDNSSLLEIVRNLSPLLLPNECLRIKSYRKLGAAINGGLRDDIRQLIVDIGL